MPTFGQLLDLVYDVAMAMSEGHLHSELDDKFMREFSGRAVEIIQSLSRELAERGIGDDDDNFMKLTDWYVASHESISTNQIMRSLEMGETSSEQFKELRRWLMTIHNYFIKFALPGDLHS